MVRFIVSILVLLVFTTILTGCLSSRKSTNELRGLMLVENTQLGRNRSYYSKRGAKKIVKKHNKFHERIKRKSFRKK